MKDFENRYLENEFAVWSSKVGINKILLDLDDTICGTRELFRKYQLQAYEYLAQNAPYKTVEQWKEEIIPINDKLFEEIGVNPIRWNLVVNELARKYVFDEAVSNDVIQILSQIYKTPLTFLDGAEEGLKMLKATEIPIGFVTHANVVWTRRKYDWLDLQRFVKFSDIYIVDENGHKTVESWDNAFSYFGHKSSECIVIGDSPRSDINPAFNLGVRYLVLVEGSDLWSVHKQEIPRSVVTVNRLDQVIEKLLKTGSVSF